MYIWIDFGLLLPSSQASISDDEIRERMSEWDEDGDGSINFAEFLSAMTRILTDTDNEDRMKEAFQLFDKVGGKNIPQSPSYIFPYCLYYIV